MEKNTVQKAIMNIYKTAGDSRPILQNLHIEQTKTTNFACITDSHRLLLIDDYNQSEQPVNVNLNPASFNPDSSGQNYPDCCRLLPTTSNLTLTLDQSSIEQLIVICKSTVKNERGEKILRFDFSNDQLVANSNSNNFSINVKKIASNGEFEIALNGKFTITLNAVYMKQALEFFKDMLKNREPGDPETIEISFIEELRPFLITWKNYKYLITPIRTF